MKEQKSLHFNANLVENRDIIFVRHELFRLWARPFIDSYFLNLALMRDPSFGGEQHTNGYKNGMNRNMDLSDLQEFN